MALAEPIARTSRSLVYILHKDETWLSLGEGSFVFLRDRIGEFRAENEDKDVALVDFLYIGLLSRVSGRRREFEEPRAGKWNRIDHGAANVPLSA